MRVVKILVGLALALLVLGAIVAWTLPARVAWRFAAPRVPALQLDGVEGSVWHGHAASAAVAGMPLGQLDWDLAFAPLLHGEARATIRITGAAFHADGVVARRADGALEIRAATIDGPAAPLQQALGMKDVEPLGSLHATIDHARIRQAWFDDLAARVDWRDAGVTGPVQAHLGTIGAVFTLDAEHRVHATIADDGKGPLEVAGQFVAAPTGYSLTAHLAARNPDDWQTQEALGVLGQRQADGSVLLKVEGRLLGLPAP